MEWLKSRSIRLGLGPNPAQFTLLVVVNAFVGVMVGLDRSILPALAEQEFQLAARTAVLFLHRGLRCGEGGQKRPASSAGRFTDHAVR